MIGIGITCNKKYTSLELFKLQLKAVRVFSFACFTLSIVRSLISISCTGRQLLRPFNCSCFNHGVFTDKPIFSSNLLRNGILTKALRPITISAYFSYNLTRDYVSSSSLFPGKRFKPFCAENIGSVWELNAWSNAILLVPSTPLCSQLTLPVLVHVPQF